MSKTRGKRVKTIVFSLSDKCPEKDKEIKELILTSLKRAITETFF